MKKIAVIMCWIGPLPDYFPLWRNSCAANPSIDFLLFSDQQVEGLPGNIHLFPTTLADIADTARKNLNFPDLVMDKPYKLCDYKVMYGEIFKEQLAGYDFWGYCDMDMLFGNIRKFLTDELLDQYDKLLTCGHLSLYRNTPEVNRRYLEKGGFWQAEEVMRSPKNFAFDEWDGIFGIYRSNNFPMYEKMPFASVSSLHKRFTFLRRSSKKYPTPADDHNYQVFYYENGEILRTYRGKDRQLHTDDFLYLHIPKREFPPITQEIAESPAVYCTPGGYVLKEPGVAPDLALIKKLNPYYGKLFEKIESWVRRKILNRRFYYSRFARKNRSS